MVNLTLTIDRDLTLECTPCNLWASTLTVRITTFFALINHHRRCRRVG